MPLHWACEMVSICIEEAQHFADSLLGHTIIASFGKLLKLFLIGRDKQIQFRKKVIYSNCSSDKCNNTFKSQIFQLVIKTISI